jgi:hypothetical protein
MIVTLLGCAVGAGVAWDGPRPAQAFLGSLGSELRAKAVVPFEGDARSAWAYTPGPRPGLSYRDLAPASQRAAERLLRSVLSPDGFRKVEAIRLDVEAALRELEGNPGRDSALYFVTLFGEPSTQEPWSWRFEGHHISLNYTFHGGKLVSSTPQFLGANPAEIRSGPKKGLRVLAEEEEQGRSLARSLTEEQRREAVLSERAPADILTSNHRTADLDDPRGLPYERMDSGQRAALRSLVRLYAEVQGEAIAAQRLARIEKGGWDKLRFVWMGSLEPGQGHYYRIVGQGFAIEYDNTQNRANHIHSVWRDFANDFGRDALAEHYRASPHHSKRNAARRR